MREQYDPSVAKSNVIVLSWNALDSTKVTLDSLFNATKNAFELTLVDNASTDGTQEYIVDLEVPDNCTAKHVVLNETNLGPGGGYNEGFKVSFERNISYTAVCNNDLYFQKGWLEMLERHLDEHEDTALVGPLRPSTKVKFNNDLSTAARLATVPGNSGWQSELELYMERPLEEFEEFCDEIRDINGGQGSETLRIMPDALSTCVALARTSIFYTLGYFAHPSFKAYGGEDIDTSWTLGELGYKCTILRDAYVHHFRGKSIGQNKLDRAEFIRRGNEQLYGKWRDQIHSFLNDESNNGVDVNAKMQGDSGDEYWILNRLNRDLHFWHNGSLQD